jgi:hypothetical protein
MQRVVCRWPCYQSDAYLERITYAFLYFLAQVRENPQLAHHPSTDVDLVWHSFILRAPLEYVRLTTQVFGGYLCHVTDPTEAGDPCQETKLMKNACKMNLHHRTFQASGNKIILYLVSNAMKTFPTGIHSLVAEFHGLSERNECLERLTTVVEKIADEKEAYTNFRLRWKSKYNRDFQVEETGFFCLADALSSIEAASQKWKKLAFEERGRQWFIVAQLRELEEPALRDEHCRCCAPEFYTGGEKQLVSLEPNILDLVYESMK